MSNIDKLIQDLELEQLFAVEAQIQQRIKQIIEKEEITPLEVAIIKHMAIKSKTIWHV